MVERLITVATVAGWVLLYVAAFSAVAFAGIGLLAASNWLFSHGWRISSFFAKALGYLIIGATALFALYLLIISRSECEGPGPLLC